MYLEIRSRWVSFYGRQVVSKTSAVLWSIPIWYWIPVWMITYGAKWEIMCLIEKLRIHINQSMTKQFGNFHLRSFGFMKRFQQRLIPKIIKCRNDQPLNLDPKLQIWQRRTKDTGRRSPGRMPHAPRKLTFSQSSADTTKLLACPSCASHIQLPY